MVVELDDEQAEAACVVSGVRRDSWTTACVPAWLSVGEDMAVHPEEICVVGRSRYALEATLASLSESGIEHQFGSGTAGLFDTRLFHGLHYAMRVASNPRDLLSLENLVALLAPLDDDAREALRVRPVSRLLADLADEASVDLDPAALLDPMCLGDALDAALKFRSRQSQMTAMRATRPSA